MKLNMRLLERKDFQEIIQLWIKEFRKSPWNEKWTEEKVRKTLSDYLLKGRAYVAIKDNKVVGFAIISESYYVNGPLAKVEMMAIIDQFRGMGLGKSFLNFIEKIYRRRGFVNLYVTTIRKSQAYNFFKKRNFKDSRYDALVVKKLK